MLNAENILNFNFISELPRAPRGFEYVNSTVSTDGRGIFVFVEKKFSAQVLSYFKRFGAKFPNAKMQSKAAFKLIVIDNKSSREINIPQLDITFPLCDFFCDGRILLAGARCSWRGTNDFDMNGVIFSPETGSIERILLGDGIASLGIDSKDRIWVSYFDEGVFGNFGWNHPGPPGPGAGGLVCFASNGKTVWSFNTDECEGFIDDCYALNVQRHVLWAYYYSDFNICRVDGNFTPYILPDIPISGASAFAVGSEGLLFTKQYDETADMFHFIPKKDGKTGQPQKVRGALPNGETFENSFFIGRGNFLHVLNSSGWFKVDVENFVHNNQQK